MNSIFDKTYKFILLEEILNNVDVISKINLLDEPFKTYLIELRKAMFKASTDDLTTVNAEVNIWRDKIIEAFKNESLDEFNKNSINEILMYLTAKYIELMKGCDSGYAI